MNLAVPFEVVLVDGDFFLDVISRDTWRFFFFFLLMVRLVDILETRTTLLQFISGSLR